LGCLKLNNELEKGKYVQMNVAFLNTEYQLNNSIKCNHLGNVLATVSDRRTPISAGGTHIDYYEPDVTNATLYYPFGSELKTYNVGSSKAYRYGYQGSECDCETKGSGNSYTTFYRSYDARIGRWLSRDPVTHPWESPYAAMSNNPAAFNDPLGDCVECSENVASPMNGQSYNTSNGSKWIYDETLGEKGGWIKEIKPVRIGNNNMQLHYGEAASKNTQYFIKDHAYNNPQISQVVSTIDFWSDLPDDYNSQTGYIYTLEDLKVRHFILHEGSSSANRNWLLKREAAGYSTPLSTEAFEDYFKSDADKTRLKLWAPMAVATSGFIGGPVSRPQLNTKNFNYTRAKLLSNSPAAKNVRMQGYKFTGTTAKHMANPARHLNINHIDEVISNPHEITSDPQGTNAMMHYGQIMKYNKNNVLQTYNVEVLYNYKTSEIMHFKYTRKAIGPFNKIPRAQ